MIKKRKFYLSILVVFFLGLLVGGYFDSDAVFYRKLIKVRRIETPDDAFAFFKTSTIGAFQDSMHPVPVNGMPTRDIIECHRGFWCDEGAIGMGKLLEYTKTRYEYRLVDILGLDNIAHHTVLQVMYKGDWKTYDLLFKTDSLIPQQTVHFPVSKLRYRVGPRLKKYIIIALNIIR
jgi:hypothetical protein